MQAAIEVLERQSIIFARMNASGASLSVNWVSGFEWAVSVLRGHLERDLAKLSSSQETGIIPEREWEQRAEEAERGDVATAHQRHNDAEEMKRKAQAYQDERVQPTFAEREAAFWSDAAAREATSEPILDMTTEGRAKRPWPL